MDYTVSLLESQVDWLTATRLADADRQPMTELAVELLRLEHEGGSPRRQWGREGYKGWTAGRVDFGHRPDSSILRVRGKLSHERFDDCRAVSDHFTRLDLAVTARYDPFTDELAKEKKDGLEGAIARRGFKTAWDFHESSKEGDTLYLGRRSSQFFARLYNKQRESGQPYYESCWRWELECKQAAASNAGSGLARAPDRTAYIQSVVRKHFTKRGVPADWGEDGDELHGRAWFGEPDLTRHQAYFRRTLAPLMAKYRGTPGYGLLLQTLGVPESIAAQAAAASALSPGK